MSEQSMTVQLEIPAEVAQQDVWHLEEQLSQVTGITTELHEPKDLIAATILFVHVVWPYAAQAVAVAGGINTLHDLAQHIYDFLHPKKQETNEQPWKNKVVIIKNGKRIELYNLTPQQIERIVAQ